MILLRLFLVFSKIGIFNFGGGYAMLSFIQNEVVSKNAWLTESEFTDIVAISQMTPGPIGINAATYVGYTAVMSDPAMQATFSSTPWALSFMGILGSVIATISVLWLPFLVMLIISRIIIRHKNSPIIKSIFAALRPAIIGLIAAASLVLMTPSNFGSPTQENWPQFALSLAIFLVVFWGSKRFNWNLILTICAAGIVGFVAYGLPLLVS